MSTLTRFAPSLTGYLHVGHVVHLMHVWGAARAFDGHVLLRIEDHDLARSRPEYERAILEDLQWLGFFPMSGLSITGAPKSSPYRQSDCAPRYMEALHTLSAQGRVYGCDCSRKDIVGRQSTGASELCYTGTCAEKNLPLVGNTVRFRVSHETVIFRDLALGECHQTPKAQCGDFSLRDRAGQWTYQFCCVCDDLRHDINLVVRGADLLASTGRQIQLFHALGHTPPRYLHHPLLCDEAGNKLSKRQHAESLSHLRATGLSAEEVIGRTALSSGLLNTYRPLSATTAIHYVVDSMKRI